MKKKHREELLKVKQELPPEDYIKRAITLSKISLQEEVVKFLNRAYGGLLIATMGIFFLQGFHLWGFDLPTELLKWLGGATIGEIVGLAALVYGQLFRK